MKGKICKKHKNFYSDLYAYENQQSCEGDGTILDNCNPLETVLRGQGNDEALDALNTIENEGSEQFGISWNSGILKN